MEGDSAGAAVVGCFLIGDTIFVDNLDAPGDDHSCPKMDSRRGYVYL